ncbi:MAG TPA: alkaline phosphatase family protein [Dehalococcoidales bacterium]|nr:alkaline phosphatase family protein [Dehalococcoidales bacterium]
MTARPKKVVILGLDAPIAPRLYKYCKEGKLPNIAKVISNGVWAKNSMVPLPTITPPNWTSIATGAWPSTHGVTDFNVHRPGDPLDLTHGGFYSGDVRAEYVWNAIARAGKKSVVVNYPTTWPPVIKDGIQIGGAGVEVNQWFWPSGSFGSEIGELPSNVDDKTLFRFAQHGVEAGAPGQMPRCSMSFSHLFATRELGEGTAHALPFAQQPGQLAPEKITLQSPSGWSNLPPAKQALEATITFHPLSGLYKMSDLVWYMLVLDTSGKGYDKVLISDSKDASSPMAELSEGQWSRIIRRDFETEAGNKKAAFAMKLLKLSDDAQDIRLFHTPLCALEGWSFPESLASEVYSEKGLPYAEPSFLAYDMGYYDIDTVLEATEMERQWLSDTCTYILKNKPWDLFMMHYHPPDHAWHSISWLMDPATAKDETEWRKYQEVELEIYRLCDRLAGDLFSCADPKETVFALVSDHGAKATNGPQPPIQRILIDAGLQVRNQDGSVDWSRTRAIGQRSVYVYINLKGRDPDGIVEPGEEYRKVQEQIIRALTDYTDPQTGRKPILFALRKEDARFINIYGDYVGDVIFAIDEHFGGQHGAFLPTAEWGIGSLRGVFAMSGPGIRRGVELERNVWCLDMVPTLCYLTGWPMPKDAEGAVIFQALEDPDPR